MKLKTYKVSKNLIGLHTMLNRIFLINGCGIEVKNTVKICALLCAGFVMESPNFN
jgi:hypothetical protein